MKLETQADPNPPYLLIMAACMLCATLLIVVLVATW
jgi:hypothetical protein